MGTTAPSGTNEIVNDEVCLVDSFGTAGSGDGQFDEPAGLALDEDDNLLYVADTENNRVQVFEMVTGSTCPSGTDEVIDGVCFVELLGSFGSDPGEFNNPMGLALDPATGSLYIADSDNHRVQIFSTEARFNPVPVAPTGLAAFPVSPTSIAITWDTPPRERGFAEVTGYKIEARTSNTAFYTTLEEDTNSSFTAFLHTGLDEDTTYHYRVSAVTSQGTSSPSSTVTASPEATQTPAALHAFPISRNQISLSWYPPSQTFDQTITGYVIEREILPNVYDEIATVNGGTTRYTVNGLAPDRSYTFVVSARFPIGRSPNSNAATATPNANAGPPSSSILSWGLAQPVYSNGESFAFMGRELLGRKSVFVIIRDSAGRFIGMASDPSSDADGTFETLPRPVATVFTEPGTYTATAFTDDQREVDGRVLQLTYDGQQLFATPMGTSSAALTFQREHKKSVDTRLATTQERLIDASPEYPPLPRDKRPNASSARPPKLVNPWGILHLSNKW